MYQLLSHCDGWRRRYVGEHGRVRRVEDRDALDDVRMVRRQVPRDDAAPVVPDHLRALAAQRRTIATMSAASRSMR